MPKGNSFARTGREFLKACHRIKADFDSTKVQFASLEEVMDTLHHLKKNENVIFETKLPTMAGMGDECYPFARNKDMSLEYEIFSSTYPWFDMDVLRGVGMSPIEENVTYDFTEDAVWEMFLLSEITRHLPLFWHAKYAEVRYILCTKDLKDLQGMHCGLIGIDNVQGFFSPREARKMASIKDVSSLLPTVALLSDKEAIISLVEWSEWGGLSRRIIRVKKGKQGLRFLKPKVQNIIKYSCGICF